MITGMYRISGLEVFASQLKTLVLSTPSCFCHVAFCASNPSRRATCFLVWS
jgi:hypothetical protein